VNTQAESSHHVSLVYWYVLTFVVFLTVVVFLESMVLKRDNSEFLKLSRNSRLRLTLISDVCGHRHLFSDIIGKREFKCCFLCAGGAYDQIRFPKEILFEGCRLIKF